MYTKTLFGKELKARVAQEQKASTIGGWAYNVYYGKLEDDEDGEFSDILLILGCMDNGEAELDNGAVIREIRRRVE